MEQLKGCSFVVYFCSTAHLGEFMLIQLNRNNYNNVYVLSCAIRWESGCETKNVMTTSGIFLTAIQEQWLTNGRPRPARAQLTCCSSVRMASATGVARFAGGNTQVLQEGQVYPAGAVLEGSCWQCRFKHDQWNTSETKTLQSQSYDATSEHI